MEANSSHPSTITTIPHLLLLSLLLQFPHHLLQRPPLHLLPPTIKSSSLSSSSNHPIHYLTTLHHHPLSSLFFFPKFIISTIKIHPSLSLLHFNSKFLPLSPMSAVNLASYHHRPTSQPIRPSSYLFFLSNSFLSFFSLSFFLFLFPFFPMFITVSNFLSVFLSYLTLSSLFLTNSLSLLRFPHLLNTYMCCIMGISRVHVIFCNFRRVLFSL